MTAVLVPVEVTPGEATDEEVRAATLAWAQEFKPCEELPRGIPRNPWSCPLANATGLIVSAKGAVEIGGRLDEFRLPPLVLEFVRRFDARRYPDLIA